jgi:hypothetical protein
MNRFLKLHLYLFEGFTILITLWILGTLFYYIAIYKYTSNISTRDYKITKVNFDIIINESTSSDVEFPVISVNKDGTGRYTGYVILNENQVEVDLLNQFNTIGLEKCFLFEDVKAANVGKNYLSIIGSFFDDFICVILFVIIIIFITFMKINLSKLNFSLIRKSKFSIFKYQYFFSYIIFHLTVLLILPTLYRTYTDFSFNFCFSMDRVYYNAVLFDRKFLFTKQSEDLQIYTKTEYNTSDDYKDHLFFFNNRSFINDPPENTYVLNIALLCVVVWICQINSIFGGDVVKKPLTRRRKIWRVISYILLYLFWLFFLGIGLLDLINQITLYYGLIFHNGVNLGNIYIIKSMIVFYSQIYFYIIFILVSIKKRRLKKEINNKLPIGMPEVALQSDTHTKLLSEESVNINEASQIISE